MNTKRYSFEFEIKNLKLVTLIVFVPKKYMKDGQICFPFAFAGMFGNMFLKILINERVPREEQGNFFV